VELRPLTIICGHYGTGKTNLAVNLAADAARAGKKVTLVDLDIVNPYFRSADHAELLRPLGVKVLASAFANTNVEIPAMPDGLSAALDDGIVIIDAGGDDAGAVVLGTISDKIRGTDHDMWYVVNLYRPMVSDPSDSAEMMRAIESASRLKVTGIVNNSHLRDQTSAGHILRSADHAERISEMTGVPLVFTTCPEDLCASLREIGFLYPVVIYVKTPWEKEGS
jgi:Mrp family chromosome partitioning ATPase